MAALAGGAFAGAAFADPLLAGGALLGGAVFIAAIPVPVLLPFVVFTRAFADPLLAGGALAGGAFAAPLFAGAATIFSGAFPIPFLDLVLLDPLLFFLEFNTFEILFARVPLLNLDTSIDPMGCIFVAKFFTFGSEITANAKSLIPFNILSCTWIK
jgi:hypothetical protein